MGKSGITCDLHVHLANVAAIFTSDMLSHSHLTRVPQLLSLMGGGSLYHVENDLTEANFL